MTDLMEIGTRLARLREISGCSQEALAEKIGCCAITVSRWENGHTPMKVMDVVKISEALNVSTDYLLNTEITSASSLDCMAGWVY